MAEVNRNIDIAEKVVPTTNSANTLAPSILSRKNIVAKALAAVLAVTSVSCAADESFEEPSLSKNVGSKETKEDVPYFNVRMSDNSDLRTSYLDFVSNQQFSFTLIGESLDDPADTFKTEVDINGLTSVKVEFENPVSSYELSAFDEEGHEIPINKSLQPGTIRGNAIVEIAQMENAFDRE